MNTTINPNQALWEQGDFTRIAASMRQSGEDLIGTCAIRAGMKVLDPFGNRLRIEELRE